MKNVVALEVTAFLRNTGNLPMFYCVLQREMCKKMNKDVHRKKTL